MDLRHSAHREVIREGDVLLGKYRVERVAVESMIITAEALHLEMGNRAQILLLSPHERDFAYAREHFMQATQALTKMQSKHVARILDAGTLQSGAPFMVTHSVGMTDLAMLTRDYGPLSVTDAVDYVIQVSEALAEGHSHGIIHGSLKPSNIRLATGIDGLPVAALLGFGVMAQWALGSIHTGNARPRGSTLPSSSVNYMSPEQIRHPMDLDVRTDIWSIGAILHELLAGEPLYRTDNNAALLASIVADPTPPVTAFRDGVPRQIETILLRCLTKERTARYPSMAELVRALEPFASAETRGMVECIARVVARHGESHSIGYRSPNAMVRVRRSEQPGARYSVDPRVPSRPPRELQSHPAPRPESARQWRLGVIVGFVVVVGLLAGIGGGLVTTSVVRNPALFRQISTSTRDRVPQTQVFAATPSPAQNDNPTLAVPSAAASAASHVTEAVRNRPSATASNSSVNRPKAKLDTAADASLFATERAMNPKSIAAKSIPTDTQLFDDIK